MARPRLKGQNCHGSRRHQVVRLGVALARFWAVALHLIANLLFPLVFATPLRNRLVESGAAWTLWTVFLPYLSFGFYQEVVYRGMVQLEVVRRWGAFAGILGANVLYTVGPLHWNYFSSPLSQAGPMFASIFVIGLFFGLLFARSGNLWIVAAFHAIGNAYIVASLGPVGPGAG